jgi:predicted dehydrogenase
MKRVKIGLIGCGKIADCAHTPALLDLNKKAKITALFDLNQKAAESLKKKYSLDSEIYKSVEELLESDVDGVIISTPNFSHCPLTLQALKAGKNVLVEKPMAVTLKDADKMIAAANKNGLHLQVNQSLRFNATYAKIKKMIDEGAIGKPIHIRCLRASANSPDKGWSPGAKWFIQKSAGGGIINDIAVHMADAIGWYFGKAKSVYSINSSRIKGSDVPDNVTALFDFENGATGVLELSWTLPSGGGLLEIYGDKGTIRMGFAEAKAGGIMLSVDGGKYKPRKPSKVKNSYQCFIDGINKHPSAPKPEEIGRKALAYCEAIAKSGETGKPVAPKL